MLIGLLRENDPNNDYCLLDGATKRDLSADSEGMLVK